jgi:cilia- and flagella-associated protein 57
MRLSYDNNFLFTAGQDGALIIHDVKDKDPRGGKREREGLLNFSDEILTKREELDNYTSEKENLENEFTTNN